MSNTEFSLPSGPEGRVETVETSGGRGGRRSWSAAEKDRIVGETLSGKESVGSVARRHGLTAQQLYGWRRRSGIDRMSGLEDLGFAAVVVARSAIEIDLCGMTIRVAAGVDEATLRSVLQAAKAVS